MCRPILLAAFLIAIPGCAMIVKGTQEKVFFDSDPPGAEILYGRRRYVTPCLISLQKQYSPIRLRVQKEGYKRGHVVMPLRFNGLVFGNLFFGGPIGIAIDLATASTMSFEEENVRIILVPVEHSSPPPSSGLAPSCISSCGSTNGSSL